MSVRQNIVNIGTSIRTLPTVKPKLYAGKVGTIAVRNEDELGVLINGKIVWFVEKEIEECMTTVTVPTAVPPTNARGTGPQSSSKDSVKNARENTGPNMLPGRASSLVTRPDRSLGTQERAREGQGAGAKLPGEQSGTPGGPQTATAIDSWVVPGSERPSEPRPPSAAPRGSGDLSGFNPGERGPGGGVVAQCVACGVLWERPKQRGRPSLKCEECR